MKTEVQCYNYIKDANRPKGGGRCTRFVEATVTECQKTEQQCKIYKKVCNVTDKDGLPVEQLVLPRTQLLARTKDMK